MGSRWVHLQIHNAQEQDQDESSCKYIMLKHGTNIRLAMTTKWSRMEPRWVGSSYKYITAQNGIKVSPTKVHHAHEWDQVNPVTSTSWQVGD
jgi:hypothetical protein